MTLQQQLTEALEARRKLVLGIAVQEIGNGDRQLKFASSLNIEARLRVLDTYIADLRRQINGRRPVRSRVTYVVPD